MLHSRLELEVVFGQVACLCEGQLLLSKADEFLLAGVVKDILWDVVHPVVQRFVLLLLGGVSVDQSLSDR